MYITVRAAEPQITLHPMSLDGSTAESITQTVFIKMSGTYLIIFITFYCQLSKVLKCFAVFLSESYCYSTVPAGC